MWRHWCAILGGEYVLPGLDLKESIKLTQRYQALDRSGTRVAAIALARLHQPAAETIGLHNLQEGGHEMFMHRLWTVAAALTLLISASGVHAEDELAYVVVPTAEVSPDWQYIMQHVAPHSLTRIVNTYTDTSDQALQAWCSDISPARSSIVISTKSITDFDSVDCGIIESSPTMTIDLLLNKNSPHVFFVDKQQFAFLNMYLRSSSIDGLKDLSSQAKGYLAQVYPEAEKIPHGAGFFPDFCGLCGCCLEAPPDISP